jgi:hypothetical protein
MNVEVSQLIGRRRLAGLFCGLFVELVNLGLWGRMGRPRLWLACRCIEIALLLLLFVRAYLLALLIRRRRYGEIDRVWRLF